MKKKIYKSLITMLILLNICPCFHSICNVESNSINTCSNETNFISTKKINDDINKIEFGNIIDTKKINPLFPLSFDTYFVEKKISAYNINLNCNKYEIIININEFNSIRFDYIIYNVLVEIDGVEKEKEIIVGSNITEIIFPYYIENVEKGDIFNINLNVYSSLILPLIHVPLNIDINPNNNKKTCTFFIGDFTPPSIEIIKPENAIYFKGNNLINFFKPVLIGDTYIQIHAYDNESGVSQVDFLLNNYLVCSDGELPYSWHWTTKYNERLKYKYNLKIIAYDKSGNYNEKLIKILKFL